MEQNRWIPCKETNYWLNSETLATIVKVKIDNKWCLYTQDTCPYGWNVLCDNNAMLMDIKL